MVSAAVAKQAFGRRRMTTRRCLRFLGLPWGTRFEVASAVLKAQLVSARRNQDEAGQRLISQIKAFLKRNLRRTCAHPGCADGIRPHATHCRLHMMIWAAVCILAFGPASVARPLELPRLPVTKPVLHSPRGAELWSGVRMKRARFTARTAAPVWRFLEWEHGELGWGTVAFDIESSSTPDGPWQKIATVAAPPFVFWADQPQQYFRVGAHYKAHRD